MPASMEVDVLVPGNVAFEFYVYWRRWAGRHWTCGGCLLPDRRPTGRAHGRIIAASAWDAMPSDWAGETCATCGTPLVHQLWHILADYQ